MPSSRPPVQRRTRVLTSTLMLCALLISFVGFAPIPLATLPRQST